MKLRVLTNKLVGAIIANTIYSPRGTILLRAGGILTQSYIKKLHRMGITTVYIEDDTCPIELQEILDTKIKLDIIKDIAVLFNIIEKDKNIDVDLAEKIIKKTLENINISENAFLYNNVSFNDSNDFTLVIHSFEVMMYSLITGINKKLDMKRLANLGIGALLHDIGKLTSQDEEHTIIGYRLAKSNSRISTTSYLCLQQHHEYVDGSGYPEQLKEEKIYEFSKIVCIANDYVNLINDTNTQLPNDAMEIMTARAVLKYDHDIYKNFIKAIYCYPNGLEVRLNSGKVGIVLRQNKDLPTRPILAVFEEGKPVLLDLTSNENQTLFIAEVIL